MMREMCVIATDPSNFLFSSYWETGLDRSTAAAMFLNTHHSWQCVSSFISHRSPSIPSPTKQHMPLDESWLIQTPLAAKPHNDQEALPQRHPGSSWPPQGQPQALQKWPLTSKLNITSNWYRARHNCIWHHGFIFSLVFHVQIFVCLRDILFFPL